MKGPEPHTMEATALCIGFRHKKAKGPLAGPLSFALGKGEVCALLGPNGVGKTTLMKTLTGVLPALEGRVSIGGEAVKGWSPAKMARSVSMVYTGRLSGQPITVYEWVAMGRYPYTSWLGQLRAQDHAAIRDALEQTATLDLASKQTDQLSDGEFQKVAIARAIAQETPLLFLDEPTAHLDLPNRISLVRLLRQLACSHQKSILLTTHELDLALHMADRLLLMMPNGQLVQGTPEDLVLEGALEQAFHGQLAGFDKALGMFNFHPPSAVGFSYEGERVPVYWASRALARAGYATAGCFPHIHTLAVVTGRQLSDGQYTWELGGELLHSVEALMGRARALFPLSTVIQHQQP